MDKKTGKYLTHEEALEKLRHYCGFQDRCHQEVWHKLHSLGVFGEKAEELILQLMNEGFLDEERFARNYVRSKLKYNQWGRVKITQGLRQKGIHERLMNIAFEEIDENAYAETLSKLMAKKWESLSGEKSEKRRQKVAQYLIRKGFEPDLVWQYLEDME